MKLLSAFLFGVLIMTTAAILDPCPPRFEIGQTYNEIKAGPCPDIETQARFKADSTHVAYYCPSKNVMVIGDMVSHKMVGFFLYEAQ